MESQKSLTLGWRWFSEWVSDCHFLFYLQRLQIRRLWIILTNPISNCHIYQNNNRWRTIDAYFQVWAVIVVRYVLLTSATNMSVLHNRNKMQFSITCLTRPWIVDAVVTLIFRMGQWPWRLLFRLWGLPIRRLCKTTTQESSNYLT